MSEQKLNDMVQSLEKLMRIWDRLSLAVAETCPNLSPEEQERLTREGMDLLIKGLKSTQVH